MIGGLADWFAVAALFRHPLGFQLPHTAIIPKSKDRIAENLANFVREKFLNPKALTELIKHSDPAERFATWLCQPTNAKRVGLHTANLISSWLDLVDNKPVQAFISDAARIAIGKLDFSQALGSVLGMLTKGGRHQELLNAALAQVTQALRRPEFRQMVAKRVVDWLKTEHKWKQSVLPTDWIGDKTAEAAGIVLDRFLVEVASSPAHELRKAFDDALQVLITQLKTDEEFHRKGEEIRAYVQNNPEFTNYARSLWNSLRDWLSDDLEAGSSQLQGQTERMGLWLGQKLMDDDEIRKSINNHMVELAQSATTPFADFLTHHISDTVRQWDAQDLSRQIELSIGPDLQYIRISGTAVGCCIGLLLFLLSHLAEIVR